MGVLASLRSFFSPRTLTVAGKTYTLQQFADRFAKGLYWGANVDTGVDTSQPYSQSVWVYAAVSLIASGISRMPLIVSDPDGRHPVTSGPLYDLLQQPNPKQVLSDFVEETFITTLLDGHVFWEIEGLTASGLDAVRVQNLRRLYAEIRVNERGEDFAPLWRRRMTNEPLFPGVNLFERKLHNPYNDVYGLSPIAAAQLAIYGDVAAGVYNERFFKNGGLPSIMFSDGRSGFHTGAREGSTGPLRGGAERTRRLAPSAVRWKQPETVPHRPLAQRHRVRATQATEQERNPRDLSRSRDAAGGNEAGGGRDDRRRRASPRPGSLHAQHGHAVG
jgi:phage portal protein BeeE